MEHIFYLSNDTTGQSQLAAAVAKVKYPNADVSDTAGLDEAALTTLIGTLVDDTYDDICICSPLVAAHAAGKFTAAQAITLIAKLKTANQGTTITGTCQANATKTEMILKASGPSTVNDFYNLRLVATTGSVAVSRVILDYVGSSKTCTIATTHPSAAITTTEDYTVYLVDKLHIIGQQYQGTNTGNACYSAFKDLFPTATQLPSIVKLMSGTTIFPKNGLTATGAAASTLSDSGEFSSGAYDGLDYWVAIKEATTGGGQIRKIASNDTNTLTMTVPWDVVPTVVNSTVKYQLKEGQNRLLWDVHLPKAIATYLSRNTNETWAIFKRMIDQYGDLYAGNLTGFEEEALIEKYVALGKTINEAIWAGVATAV